jgi:regulator of sigma E protease
MIVALLGLPLLMIVHEAGHYFAARKFGMRVLRFSIGFGPTLWKHRPKGSPTTFQVGIIPFLAYVQIAGMNPYEDNDPNDPQSYMNASLKARVATISAGSLANYFFASILFFFGFVIGGKTITDSTSMRVSVAPKGPAAAAQMKDGDKVVAINEAPVQNWDDLKREISAHKGEPIRVTIERGEETLTLPVTPLAEGEHAGKILIGPEAKKVKLTVAQSAVESLKAPPMVVYASVRGIVRWLSGREKAEFAGPVGIGRMMTEAAEEGAAEWLKLVGALSAYLGAFNLFPVPALDGGRLIFLLAEAASRKKPDQKVETVIHAVGLLTLLALMVGVTVKEIFFR